MALSFNLKMLAYDIAKGLVYLTPVNLKKYVPSDLKIILSHLSLVQREVRAKQIPHEEVMKMKERNRQLHNLNQAITTINTYIKQRQIRL